MNNESSQRPDLIRVAVRALPDLYPIQVSKNAIWEIKASSNYAENHSKIF